MNQTPTFNEILDGFKEGVYSGEQCMLFIREHMNDYAKLADRNALRASLASSALPVVAEMMVSQGISIGTDHAEGNTAVAKCTLALVDALLTEANL